LKAFLFVFGSLIIIIFFNSSFPRKLQLIALKYFRQIEQNSDHTANKERDQGGIDNSFLHRPTQDGSNKIYNDNDSSDSSFKSNNDHRGAASVYISPERVSSRNLSTTTSYSGSRLRGSTTPSATPRTPNSGRRGRGRPKKSE